MKNPWIATLFNFFFMETGTGYTSRYTRKKVSCTMFSIPKAYHAFNAMSNHFNMFRRQ